MLVTEPSPDIVRIVSDSMSAGVNMVQWREKRTSGAGHFRTWTQLMDIVPESVLLAANSNWEMAVARGARTIHLPEKSVPIGVVRYKIGKKGTIGKSVHSVQAAVKAERDGADYLVAGTVFDSLSHPEISGAGIEFLREICSAVKLPVLAIGGITAERVGSCIEAGAAGVAVLSALTRSERPAKTACQYREALDQAWNNYGERFR